MKLNFRVAEEGCVGFSMQRERDGERQSQRNVARKIDQDHAEQVKWWDVLDRVVERRDLAEGRALARECKHPDALWFVSLARAGDLDRLLAALQAEADAGDPRALFMVAYGRSDLAALRRSAEKGYAPAQAELSGRAAGQTALEWAQRAACQGDRAGMTRLASCLWNVALTCERDRIRQAEAIGEVPDLASCVKDRAQALALYREAAELGNREAQFAHGTHGFAACEWEGYRWLGRAVARGHYEARRSLVHAAREQLRQWRDGHCSGRVIYEIGDALRLHSHPDNGEMLPFALAGTEYAEAVRQCVAWHRWWCHAARAAVDCWSGGAARMGVPYDIRIIVVQLVWDDRSVWSMGDRP
jgi:TPR repeat protein